MDAALVERHARQVQQAPELVLDGLVAAQHDNADRRPLGDAIVQLEGHVLPVHKQAFAGCRKRFGHIMLLLGEGP